MIATYVARITLEKEADLSEIESIINKESFSEPNLYATSTTPSILLVSPYKDDQERTVRSFEVTDYLVKTRLLPQVKSKQGPVTQMMVDEFADQLGGKYSRVELYRVSATDVLEDNYSFFNMFIGYEDRGPGPFIPVNFNRDIRPVVYSGHGQMLIGQD